MRGALLIRHSYGVTLIFSSRRREIPVREEAVFVNLLRMLTRFTHAKLSHLLIAVATIMLTGWFQAQIANAALVEDGANLHHAIAVIDDSEMRGALANGLQSVMTTIGRADQGQQLGQAVREAPTLGGPVGDVLVSSILTARDQIAVQLDLPKGEKYTAVNIPMVPILNAFGVPITQEQIDEVGFGQLVQYPVLTAQSMQVVAQFDTWLRFADTWGLLIGIVAGIAGVLLARKPLRALGVLSGIIAVIAFTAPFLFSWLQSISVGGKLGSLGVLLNPLWEAADSASRPWVLPVGIVGLLAAVGFIVLDVRTRKHRAAAASGHEREHERDEAGDERGPAPSTVEA